MIRAELLQILRCPETHQQLAPAPPELIDRLNVKARAGLLRNRAGKPIEEPLQEALVREDKRFVYPIRGNLPIMLIEEALPIE